jgi:hypothetical protein
VALTPFFEPKSLVDFSERKPKLLAVGAMDINSWTRHVADGSTARLASLEEAIFLDLTRDYLTAAMVLARSHMEVAGLAAYGAQILFASARKSEWDRLIKVIQQTYFGSSTRIQEKGTPELGDHLLAEVYPFRPTDLIKAMDRFAKPDDPNYTHYQLMYGLLSEYSHPAMGATKHFAQMVSNEFEGWHLRYDRKEVLEKESMRMACEIVLNNMRVGHACCALLRSTSIRVNTKGKWKFQSPSETEVGRIWRQILQQRSS